MAISEHVGIGIREVALASSVACFFKMLPLGRCVKEHNATLANVGSKGNREILSEGYVDLHKTNKYLMLLLFSKVITSRIQTGGAVGLLVSYYHFGSSLVMAILILISLIPVILAQMQTRKLVNRFGKLKVFMVCGVIGALIQMSIYFVGPIFVICCMCWCFKRPLEMSAMWQRAFSFRTPLSIPGIKPERTAPASAMRCLPS